MPPATSYILCVDDDADDLLFITSALQQANAALRTAMAYNGVEALAFLEEVYRAHQLPSLIILDINMPRMDGKELLTALKKDARFAFLPVVVYSTSGAGIDRLFCAHYGVELVTKPNTYDEVVSVMQYLCNSMLNSPH